MSTEYVKNKIGEIIGRIEYEKDGNGNNVTYVYDKRGEIAGRCENGMTFDKIGNVVSYSEVPGMLIDKD